MPHVRFAPESGHVQRTRPCLLWANSGHSTWMVLRALSQTAQIAWLRVAEEAGQELITLNRKSVEQRGRLVVGVLRNALILRSHLSPRPFSRSFDTHVFGIGRFGPRLSRHRFDLRQNLMLRGLSMRLRLSIKDSLRCHIGCGRSRSSKSFYRIVIMRFWQTHALAGYYDRRTIFIQRRIRNE